MCTSGSASCPSTFKAADATFDVLKAGLGVIFSMECVNKMRMAPVVEGVRGVIALANRLLLVTFRLHGLRAVAITLRQLDLQMRQEASGTRCIVLDHTPRGSKYDGVVATYKWCT
jgi:hypothetical protein